ncbi:MAG: lipoyl synthase [Bradymonadia bacterium]
MTDGRVMADKLEIQGHPQDDRFGRNRHALRLPDFLKRRVGKGDSVREVKRLLRTQSVTTVCEEAKCPNLAECFSKSTATFMIMGPQCTRACGFCAVTTAPTQPLDPLEPSAVAESASALGLQHIVVTSVNRDDLADGGANHFAQTVVEIKRRLPDAQIEVLVPDFCGDLNALNVILDSPIDVFNHNVETVGRLYSRVRPRADYQRSLDCLSHAHQRRSDVSIKSGLMVGLGESDHEVMKVMQDLKTHHVDSVTIGQYLRPSLKHVPVDRYLRPEAYEQFVAFGQAIGLRHVFAGPFVRSSYNAAEAYEAVKS